MCQVHGCNQCSKVNPHTQADLDGFTDRLREPWVTRHEMTVGRRNWTGQPADLSSRVSGDGVLAPPCCLALTQPLYKKHEAQKTCLASHRDPGQVTSVQRVLQTETDNQHLGETN